MKKSNKILWGMGLAFSISIFIALVILRINFTMVTGNGHIISHTMTLPSFSRVQIGGWYQVIVEQDNQSLVTLSTEQNLLPHIDMKVFGETLRVTSQKNTWIKPSQIGHVHISTPQLNYLSLPGDSEVYIDDLSSSLLTIDIDGQSNGHISGNIQQLVLDIVGNANLSIEVGSANTIKIQVKGHAAINLSGQVEHLVVAVDGNMTLSAQDLLVEHLDVTGAGLSDMTLNVEDSITVAVMGKTNIRYYGEPKSIHNISFGSVLMEKLNK